MNYYRRHIGDYLRDTSHLSLLEHGVYTRLLDVYYTRESSIPDDQAARLIGARSKEEREAVATVLAEFFTKDGDAWRQSRCDREIEAYSEKAERNREVGKRGGRPTKPKNNPDGFQEETQTVSTAKPKPNPEETHSQEPIANSHKETHTRPSRAGASASFERFWSVYPKRRSRGQAEKAWAALKPDEPTVEAILTALAVLAKSEDWAKDGGRFIPYPATWLNAKGWLDDFGPPQQTERWWIDYGFATRDAAIKDGIPEPA